MGSNEDDIEMAGINSYAIEDDGTVSEVNVFLVDSSYRYEIKRLSEGSKGGGDDPLREDWERVGACTTEWPEDGDTHHWEESSEAVAVYVSPDWEHWTTAPLTKMDGGDS